MERHLGVALSVLLAFTWSGAAAEQKMHACSLLTPGEVSAAVGEKVGSAQESDIVIPSGPSKGETMGTCMWPVGEGGMVSVSVIRAAKGAQREAGLTRLNQAFEVLKARGWQEEKKDFASARCSIMTPPSAKENAPISTGCMAEAKGMGISVGSMSAKKKVAIDNVKTLLDKAIGRLP
jgi:hypothetical protein